MGEILLRAGLSDRLYKALNVWLDRLPGGLLHTNIAASGVFSAISGSSVATAATMGSVALPFFKGSRYDPQDGARLARRGRRTRQPDPARHHLHHLRADHRDLGRRALSRCGRPQHPRRRTFRAGDPLEGAHRRPPCRSGRAARPVHRQAAQPRRSRADGDPDPDRARHHLWRARHRDRIRSTRRRRRDRLRRDRGPPQLQDAERLGRGDSAQHRDDRADPVRRLCAELRLRQPRRAAGAGASWSARCRCRPGRSCC